MNKSNPYVQGLVWTVHLIAFTQAESISPKKRATCREQPFPSVLPTLLAKHPFTIRKPTMGNRVGPTVTHSPGHHF